MYEVQLLPAKAFLLLLRLPAGALLPEDISRLCWTVLIKTAVFQSRRLRPVQDTTFSESGFTKATAVWSVVTLRVTDRGCLALSVFRLPMSTPVTSGAHLTY